MLTFHFSQALAVIILTAPVFQKTGEVSRQYFNFFHNLIQSDILNLNLILNFKFHALYCDAMVN